MTKVFVQRCDNSESLLIGLCLRWFSQISQETTFLRLPVNLSKREGMRHTHRVGGPWPGKQLHPSASVLT
jgi:hypothetical protein